MVTKCGCNGEPVAPNNDTSKDGDIESRAGEPEKVEDAGEGEGDGEGDGEGEGVDSRV